MKKKQKTVGLLTAVIIIWGLIGYTFYKRTRTTVAEIKTAVTPKSTFKKNNETIRFHHVNGAYRDPFLGTNPQKKKRGKRKTTPTEMKHSFPSIRYNGMVKNKKTASYILTINGQQEIVKLGAVFQEVTLIAANSAEVTVLYKGSKKTFVMEL